MTTPREPGLAGMTPEAAAARPAETAQPPRQQHAASGAAPAAAVPRAGAPRGAVSPGDPGAGWAVGSRAASDEPPVTTVLPSGGGSRPARPAAARPAVRPEGRTPGVGTRPPARPRRTRLALRRIDPWSVFVFSLIAAVFLGIALVVAVAVLYAVLGSLGVTGSLNELYAEVTGAEATDSPLFTAGRIVGGAAVLAAVNVVLLTLLATLGSLLYNLVASFTGGLELTLGERD